MAGKTIHIKTKQDMASFTRKYETYAGAWHTVPASGGTMIVIFDS